MRKLLFLFLLTISGFTYAQVGINNIDPQKELDINGELRIRNTPGGNKLTNVLLSTDGVGNVEDSGTFRELVYAHMENPDPTANRVVRAAGGSNLVYGSGDWVNNSSKILLLNEATDTFNEYDPATGLFTVGAGNEGFYYVQSRIIFDNEPGTGVVFDGDSGLIRCFLALNSNMSIADDYVQVLKGVKITTGLVSYFLYTNSLVYLEAGDNIKLMFSTYGTDNMNSDLSKVILNRNASTMDIYRLF